MKLPNLRHIQKKYPLFFSVSVFLLIIAVPIFLLKLFGIGNQFATVYVSTSTSGTLGTDGQINTIVPDTSGGVYIGGTFTYIGPYTASGVPVIATTGSSTLTFPKVVGSIFSVVHDGSNGWYIGGSFTSVGGVARNRLAHILSNGNVDTNFNPNPNNTIATLAYSTSTNTLFVGGSFTSIAGIFQNFFAGLNGTDGSAITAFNKSTDALVSTLLISPDGNKIYAGGTFTQFGSTVGSGVLVSTTTGSTTVAFPVVNNQILVAIPDASGGWYVGGSFTQIGSFLRSRVAHILSDGSVDANFVETNVSANVNSLVLATSTNTLYLGGAFTSVAGVSRNRVAALNATNGSLITSFNPNVSGAVNRIVLSPDGSKLYIAGQYVTVGGIARNNLSAVNTSDGSVNSFVSDAENAINSLVISPDGSKLYMGGSFISLGTYLTSGLAVSSSTGLISTPLNVTRVSNGAVNAAISDGSNGWYIGGNFTTVGSTTRNRVAHIFADGTLDPAFAPSANNNVNTLALSSSTGILYVGGIFLTMNGVGRNRLAAVNISDGSLVTGFNPSANNTVSMLAFASSTNTLYVGGTFTVMGTTTRNRLAAVNGTDGSVVTSFVQNANNGVTGLVLSPDESKLYFGGTFTVVGPFTGVGNGIPVNSTTGVATSTFSTVNGAVASVIQDGNGGWYVGGDFTSVGTITRNRLAHLLVDGSLDANFNPNVNSTVSALILATSTNTIYFGGAFTTVGGVTRNRIAAVNATSGALVTGFDPNANNTVSTIALVPELNVLYFGGTFTTVSGVTRNRIAGVNISDGTLVTAFDPNANATVRNIANSASSSLIFVAGDFTTIASTTYAYLAALNTSDGSVLPTFYPNPNSSVFSTVLSSNGNTLYLGGAFTSIASSSRARLAAIDTTVGSTTSFNPSSNGQVSLITLSPDGNTLYAAGPFGTIAGLNRNNVVAMNSSTGAGLSAFDPNPDNLINTIAVSSDGSLLFLGGVLTGVQPVARNRVAAVNTSNGSLISTFNPNADQNVISLDISPNGNVLYLGGQFVTIAGASRARVAAVNTSDGSINSLNLGSDGLVQVVKASPDGSALYFGGRFGSPSPYNITKIRTSDGAVLGGLFTGFAPAVTQSGTTNAIGISTDGNSVYVGGTFGIIGGVNRFGAGSVNTSDGSVTAFNPSINGAAFDIAISPDGNTIYLGGNFVFMNGNSRNRLGSASATDGTTLAFNPNVNNTVNSLALSADGTKLYFGGTFTTVGATARNRAAGVNTSDASVIASFDPNPNNTVNVTTLSTNGGTLYLGGTFTLLAPATRNRIAALNTSDGSIVSAFNPNANNTVLSLEISTSSNTLYLGGTFTTIGGTTRNDIAAVNTSDGTLVSAFNPNANNQVNSFALSADGTKLYFGGTFTTVGGVARNRIAAVNTSDGSLVSSFNPNANNQINGLLISQDATKLYLGGTFTLISSTSRNRVAAVNTSDGSLITTFISHTNNAVTSIAFSTDANQIYLGGTFTSVGGTIRNFIARILSNGTVDPNFDPNANTNISTLVLATTTNTLYLGGGFTTVGGVTRNRIAAVNATSGALVTGFDPNANGTVSTFALSPDSSKLYLGGTFATIGVTTRSRIAAVNTSDGSLVSSFDPNANGNVNAVTISTNGGVLYFGGTFTTIGGITRNRLAAVNTSDGSLVTSFNPSINSTVNATAISPDGGTLYLGGIFTSVGTTTRNSLAAVNTSDGSLIATFNPNVNSTVNVLFLSTSTNTLYLGGAFSVIGGVTRARIAAVNTSNGSLLTGFDPVSNNTVFAVNVSTENILYIGGSFSLIGGLDRQTFASFIAASSTASRGHLPNNYSTFATTSTDVGGDITGGESTTTEEVLTGGATTTTSFLKPVIFTQTLKVGSIGEQVRQLQIFLNTHGYPVDGKGPGSKGKETTYFGPATQKALIKFQEAYTKDILIPQNITKGTGILLNYTKKIINEILRK